MSREVALRMSVSLGLVLVGGCVVGEDDGNPFASGYTSFGPGGTELGDDFDSGDGDGDSGDGDADSGDGDGDSGDGDADSGDGDGDTTGDCPSNGPYQGGWDTGCCQDNVVPTAWIPGGIGPNTVLPDWTFTDQFGDMVRIYDFCHEAIYFEYVAFW